MTNHSWTPFFRPWSSVVLVFDVSWDLLGVCCYYYYYYYSYKTLVISSRHHTTTSRLRHYVILSFFQDVHHFSYYPDVLRGILLEGALLDISVNFLYAWFSSFRFCLQWEIITIPSVPITTGTTIVLLILLLLLVTIIIIVVVVLMLFTSQRKVLLLWIKSLWV